MSNFFLPPRSLLSDEGLDFYGNEEASHRVFMLNEAPDKVNIYQLFINFKKIIYVIFFFLPCFKFQFELSPGLPFIPPGVSAIYTLSFNSFLFDVTLGICSPHASLSRVSKRFWDESHGELTVVNSRQSLFFFFLHPPKHPPLYLMSLHTLHFIPDKKQGRIFPC